MHTLSLFFYELSRRFRFRPIEFWDFYKAAIVLYLLAAVLAVMWDTRHSDVWYGDIARNIEETIEYRTRLSEWRESTWPKSRNNYQISHEKSPSWADRTAVGPVTYNGYALFVQFKPGQKVIIPTQKQLKKLYGALIKEHGYPSYIHGIIPAFGLYELEKYKLSLRVRYETVGNDPKETPAQVLTCYYYDGPHNFPSFAYWYKDYPDFIKDGSLNKRFADDHPVFKIKEPRTSCPLEIDPDTYNLPKPVKKSSGVGMWGSS